MNSAVHVVLCGDRNVLWGMAVAVRSALEFSSGPLAVTVIGSGLTEADRKDLRDSWDHPNTASVAIHELDYDRIKRFRSTGYLKSKVSYARYFVDDFIPEASRCVYIDTDMIVLRDLHEIAWIDLEGKTVAAALDISTRANGGQAEMCRKLGIEDPGGYFNVGFMVIDLDRYRREQAQEKLIKLSVEQFDRLDAQDQAALNVIMQGKTKFIPHIWNTIQYEAPDDFDNGILHLIGKAKPWHADYDYKFKNLFFEYLDKTAYRGKRPLGLGGGGALWTKAARLIPTTDMIAGKLRRMLRPSAATASTQPTE